MFVHYKGEATFELMVRRIALNLVVNKSRVVKYFSIWTDQRRNNKHFNFLNQVL